MSTSEYLGVFLDESREHLQAMNDGLLALESDPGSRDALDNVFRAAHTLKGMSATMGFQEMAELTHRLETILDEFRSGQAAPDRPVMDLLFKSVDRLEAMIQAIAGGEPEPEAKDLLEALQQLGQAKQDGVPPPDAGGAGAGSRSGAGAVGGAVGGPAGSAAGQPEQSGQEWPGLNEYDQAVIAEARARGYQACRIHIRLVEDCLLKSARVYLIMRALEGLGEVIKAVPPVEELEEERFDRDFELVLLTKHPVADVEQALDKLTEIQRRDIQVLQPPQEPGAGTATPPGAAARGTGKPGQQGAGAAARSGAGAGAGPGSPAGASGSISGAAQAAASEAAHPPGPANGAAGTHSNASLSHARQTVRVEIGKLDILMNLVGELVINRSRLSQLTMNLQASGVQESVEELARITSELQSVVMKARMVPIDHVFQRFPRMMRDLSHALGKQIDFVVEGGDTELDRTVVDEIGDPLVHLLRNAVDHGIEPPEARVAAGKPAVGRVRLSARHEGNQVLIELSDDGRGLDLEKIRRRAVERGVVSAQEAAELTEHDLVEMLFQPGFSTSDQVTDVSGRGVGLDVVRSKVTALNGSVDVRFNPGKGTTFMIKLPLTLAIIQALLVGLGKSEIYAIPLENIDEIIHVSEEQIQTVRGREHLLFRDQAIPVIRLARRFKTPDALEGGGKRSLVIVRSGRRRVGLMVDRLIGQQEIVIKPLEGVLHNSGGFVGATILGDGTVALILDVLRLRE
ncbi:MAG: chemotaxis protein CheA [Firmicutes bacterium]|nr:chemotaxis protein CheA [Bacillota bacterium]